MNKVALMGRLTKDPDIRYSSDGKAVARYTIAVDRRGRKDDQQQQADFIGCVAFGKAGEFAERYLAKGMKMLICGRLQTGSYTDKDGKRVFTTDVVVEEQEFAESKSKSMQNGQNDGQTASGSNLPDQAIGDGFMSIPDSVDDIGLPWN